MEKFPPSLFEPDEKIPLDDFDNPADPPSWHERMGNEITLCKHWMSPLKM
jgi:hypothetical protein